MNNMILIIGLGNPGKKYEKTRHNVGFKAVTAFQVKNGFSDFKFSKKLKAEISEGILDSKKIVLAKPQTFMNLSGKAIKLLIQKRLKKAVAELRRMPDFLWIIHDDIDLPFGKIKIVKSRGAAGHKGVESIIRELKTKDFVRFRIGIKPINSEQRTTNNIEKFVLQKFNKEEEKIVKEVIRKTVEAIEIALKDGLEKAMNEFNK